MTTIQETNNPATTTISRRINGVDLDVLMGTVTAVQNEPKLGNCRFRATNQWVDGAKNRSCIQGFYAAQQEMQHKQTFTMDADEPAILAGCDDAANPVEHLLHALASCLTTSIVAHAAVRGIAIEQLESQLEGDIDLNGFLGLSPEVPKGFTTIRAQFRVQAKKEDIPQLRELMTFSPVFNTIINGAKVELAMSAM